MPLPFDLPAVTRGFTELTPGAREVGREVAERVASALATQLGIPFGIEAVALPGHSAPGAGCARVGFDLPALPGTAVLEVDSALVAGMVDRLGGGTGDAVAVSLTPVEVSALELFALLALDATGSVEPVERRLSPRLSRACVEPASPLAIGLTLIAHGRSGRARLLLPAAAVRALGAGGGRLPTAVGAAGVTGSLRQGRATLDERDLAALGCGDVVLLDEGTPAGSADLRFDSGLVLRGRLDPDRFVLEEIMMEALPASFPVTLEIELARVTVTLDELSRLEPGAALSLPVSRRGEVVLRVGNRAVARGELVDVDGAVGVRIVSMGDRP